MEWIMLTFWFVVGSCLGSFYNVVGLRIPKNESIVFPGSHCPNCQYVLRPWDLVPIVSFIGLGGKCRKCQTKMSWIYPSMELLTGLIFMWSYYVSGLTWTFAFWALLLSVMVVLTVADIAYQRVPNKILLAVFPILVPFGVWVSEETLWSHVLGGVVFFFGLFFVSLVTKGGIGGGDIKLFGLLGLCLGLAPTFVVFFIACVTGSVLGIFMQLINKGKRVIPFVPYIAVGVMCTLWYGDALWQMMLNR